jgi:hypothetical protein
LVSGFIANKPTAAVFADSRLIKQDINQNANCETVGANSPVSDSCDQRTANNVNNGVPRTSGAAAPNTGTLIVNKVCVTSTGGGTCPGNPSFGIQVIGTNSPPSSFSLPDGGSQAVTLAPGSFTVREAIDSDFTPSFSGNCNGAAGSGEATGTIAAGEQQTCTITNTAVPATGTLTVNKVCVAIIRPELCQATIEGQFNLVITGNNPNPPGFSLRGGGSQDITLGSGPFTLTEIRSPQFTGSVSGDCALVSDQSGKLVATGTISEGQHPICTITNNG